MSKEIEEINVLDELNKGACMGMDAIHFIMDKVEDDALNQELIRQYSEYQKIHNKICKLYPEYSRDEPHETTVMNKAMTWYGIQKDTMAGGICGYNSGDIINCFVFKIFHFFAPPNNLRAVNISIYGLRIFIIRIANETPSGYAP